MTKLDEMTVQSLTRGNRPSNEMSIREYTAIHVLSGLSAHYGGGLNEDDEDHRQMLAVHAVNIADALISDLTCTAYKEGD
jgi:hypothetical protein